MKQWYRISLWCGLLPLCVGISIFLIWLNIRSDWLELAGVFTMIAGLILFAIGIISLAIYSYDARKYNTEGYFKRSLVALTILLANFPVAALILSEVSYELSTSIVKVENNSEYLIEDIFLSDRVNRYEIGSLAPNEALEKEIHFKSEGEVNYSFKRNGVKYDGIIFGYVTGGMAFSAVMVITKSGEVEIHEKI